MVGARSQVPLLAQGSDHAWGESKAVPSPGPAGTPWGPLLVSHCQTAAWGEESSTATHPHPRCALPAPSTGLDAYHSPGNTRVRQSSLPALMSWKVSISTSHRKPPRYQLSTATSLPSC